MAPLPVTSQASSTAAPRLDLLIPPPLFLTTKEELEFARKAFAQSPHSIKLRYRLAAQLVNLDHFDEAISLLEAVATPDFRRFQLLYTAYIGSGTTEGTLEARAAAQRAVDAADGAESRSIALADLAKTYTRLGEVGKSEELLLEALQADPGNKDAYKRLSRLYVRRSPHKALDLAYRMIDLGALHARVLGSVPLVLAGMGRFEEAHAAEGLDEFLVSRNPGPPAGWESTIAFNETLAAEILRHPDMRYERYGTASSKTWRVDQPSLQRGGVFPQLQRLIRQEITNYVEWLGANDHPWARACPAKAKLHNWCVVTQGEGHETWHVHQNGWMSGVYYIHVQDHIANGTGREGCLVFGLSDEIAGEAVSAAYGERLVRPHTGLMMMFPSHSFHKTYPHCGEGHRICLAFDVVPANN